MTVRVAVTVIPMLLLWSLSGCQPTGGDTEASGGRKSDSGGIRGGGGRGGGGSVTSAASGGSSAGSPGNGGGVGQGGGQPAAGGRGSGGRTGTLGNGGSGGRDGTGGVTVVPAQGGAPGKDAGIKIDAGPVACDDTQSSGRLGVYYYDDGAVTGQAVQMHFDIVNYTAYGSRLSQVTVRYWFTDEDATTANVVEQYYVPIPTKMKFSTLNPPRVGADTLLEMSFSDLPDAGISWVETKGFNFAFHKTGYSGNYDQSNDYSYDAKLTKALGPNPKITAYINGVLAWGCEPAVQTAPLDAGSPALDAPVPPPVADASISEPGRGEPSVDGGS